MRHITGLGESSNAASRPWRLQAWYVVLIIISAIFIVRLFQLQVLKHGYYSDQASSGQLKAYTVEAERGIIYARDGSNTVGFVLNQKLVTLFADPKYIKNPEQVATQLSKITGGKTDEYADVLRSKDTRYVVLAKKLSKEQGQKIDKLEIAGIGTREESYRTYPQGNLAAQLVGFVDDEKEGRYGVEEALNSTLKGKDGLLKAITDSRGVPLVSNLDNIQIDPVQGQSVVLTIDVAMQRQLEDILKAGLDAAQSKSGSALIINPNNGEILALANYPTFDPANFREVKDINVFNNNSLSSPLEPGSVMKPLTAAAALEQGVVSPETTYYDPGFFRVDGYTITNIEEVGGAATRSVADILKLSLNTGATWLLRQMGGGELNSKARETWYGYMKDRYQFGKPSGVENYEVSGSVPDPLEGDGLNIRFANTSFGQGMTVTPLQLGAALSSVVNGGVYYRPHLIHEKISADGQKSVTIPEVANQHVVSEQVSQQIKQLMISVVERNLKSAKRDGFIVGGKTGTAQIAKPEGGYYDDRFNGMYIGFVGVTKPDYVVVVRVDEPKIGGYAGAKAAAPIFSATANMLMDSFGAAESR